MAVPCVILQKTECAVFFILSSVYIISLGEGTNFARYTSFVRGYPIEARGLPTTLVPMNMSVDMISALFPFASACYCLSVKLSCHVHGDRSISVLRATRVVHRCAGCHFDGGAFIFA